jgi:hypothetical protein
MVTVTNGMSVPISVALAGGLQDEKGRNIKFERAKDTNLPVYESKRKDGGLVSFTIPENALATVTVQQKTDLKALRKQKLPVPKEEAEKLDKEIKEEELKSKAAARAAEKGISREDAEREVVKEEKEAEAEREESAGETEEKEREEEKENPTVSRRRVR